MMPTNELSPTRNREGVYCLAEAWAFRNIAHSLQMISSRVCPSPRENAPLSETSDAPGDRLPQAVPSQHLICEWVSEVIHPQWRQARNELADLGIASIDRSLTFPQFSRAFLDIVFQLLQTGLRDLGDFDVKLHYSIRAGELGFGASRSAKSAAQR